jgi:hypothetical protein
MCICLVRIVIYRLCRLRTMLYVNLICVLYELCHE